jgi:hypothetical protein
VTAGLEGRVVEIGFGSGLNIGHYPAAADLVLAVEPAPVARRLAARRVAASPVAVELMALDGQSLPLTDASTSPATFPPSSRRPRPGALGPPQPT